MAVEQRHSEIIELLSKSDEPLSGSFFSKHFGVSRQIIVQDVNNLKKDGYDIIATPRGYLLNRSNKVTRIFKVQHSADRTAEELNLIVDLGAEVKDVFIYHKMYNEIRAKLSIRSRKDVLEFCNGISSGQSSLLSMATAGYHYHTVVADSEETLNLVGLALMRSGFLAELTEYEPNGIVK